MVTPNRTASAAVSATEPAGPQAEPRIEEQARRRFPLIYLAVFAGYTGQQILTPLLPPLARELSLSEFELGIVMSASAAVVTLISPFWGRRSDAWGRKPLLVGSLAGAAVGLLGFAVCAQLGLNGMVATPVLLGLLLLTRGLLFGGSLAALPVAAQSYVADVTHDQVSRVNGISRVGASLGLALVLGPGLGGLLANLGLLTALYFGPVLLAVAAVAVWVLLPAEVRRTERATPSRLSPFDARIWPFLVAGLGIYLSIALLQMSIGFLIQDRLELDPERTASVTGLTLLLGGVPMLVVQALVIPQLKWSPVRLLRVGVPITAVAFALIMVADTLPLLMVAVTLSGLGHSLAVPGYSSAPGLRVGAQEQGGAAGLIAATNAATLIVGPLLATALYQAGPALPFLVGALVLAALFGFLLLHPGVRDR
jgi:DHA1 family tetracycline resistance protein-like MFS transporter